MCKVMLVHSKGPWFAHPFFYYEAILLFFAGLLRIGRAIWRILGGKSLASSGLFLRSPPVIMMRLMKGLLPA